MKYLELTIRLAAKRFHVDISLTPFVWQFKVKRIKHYRGAEGYIAVGPLTLDWSRGINV